MQHKEPKKYMNPYLAGFILGLVIIASLYLTGRGLGASGAVKGVVTHVVDVVAPAHTQSSHFYSKYVNSTVQPHKRWLVFEIFGLIFGGLLSGAWAGRLKWKIEHSPKITSKKRLILAVIGGFIVGIGASFGRGCTSGAALSGMAVLSTAGFISFFSIFAAAFITSLVVKKFWI